jgi:signal transduction histidine kinase
VVDRERSRIARDLHDNLGADLTHLALISDLAQADAADPDKVRKCFDQIFETARNLTRQVDEIVWAVNPANDSLNGFVPFLSNYAQHFLSAAEVACRLEIPASLPDTPLSSAERHALLMLVKEALHNVVKHAHATEVRLRIRAEGSLLEIVVEDDGCGMAERVVEGDGTGNMRQRAAAIGASLERWSSPGEGTTLRVRLGLKGSV